MYEMDIRETKRYDYTALSFLAALDADEIWEAYRYAHNSAKQKLLEPEVYTNDVLQDVVVESGSALRVKGFLKNVDHAARNDHQLWLEFVLDSDLNDRAGALREELKGKDQDERLALLRDKADIYGEATALMAGAVIRAYYDAKAGEGYVTGIVLDDQFRLEFVPMPGQMYLTDVNPRPLNLADLATALRARRASS